MAEQVILVCDWCLEQPAVEQVKVTVKGRNYVLDLCDVDLGEMTQMLRPMKRGRKKATLAS
jgi:hypothetical protein